jgi:hypothetical protein
MRRSLHSAGSFATLAPALLLVSSAACLSLVACGDEASSPGQQSPAQGSGGQGGSAGAYGTAGTSGTTAGSSGAGGGLGQCPGIDIRITCDEDVDRYLTYDAQGCGSCTLCPAIPAFLGDCPGGTIDVRDAQTGCLTAHVCKDASVSCPDLAPPSPKQCPSGGFVSTYSEDGCVTGFVCQSCPNYSDPSFCADAEVSPHITPKISFKNACSRSSST